MLERGTCSMVLHVARRIRVCILTCAACTSLVMVVPSRVTAQDTPARAHRPDPLDPVPTRAIEAVTWMENLFGQGAAATLPDEPLPTSEGRRS